MQADGTALWGTIADIVGVVGMLVLGFLGWRLHRRQTELSERQAGLDSAQTKLQRRIVEIEEGRDARADLSLRRADLRAAIERGPRGVWKLVVTNIGHAVARNVEVFVNDGPVVEFDAYSSRSGPEEPFDLAEGGRIDFTMAMSSGKPFPPWYVRLAWEDDSGDDREWSSAIS